jgi:quercetin dioxygenase-like cupin family protein
VLFRAGQGHTFHQHPEQDEWIYVLQGTIRQWVNQDSHTLEAGDAVYIPRATVHGSINIAATDARLLVVRCQPLTPSQAASLEMGDKTPWSEMQL